METVLFTTPIWHWHYPGSFADAAAKCIEMSETIEGRQRSNRGGWQSNPILIDEIPELFVVRDFVNNCLREAEHNAEFKYGCQLKLEIQEDMNGVWINVNRKGDLNYPHQHPNSAFSFVCYLQAGGDGGELVVHRSDYMEHYPFDNLDSDLYAKSAFCNFSSGMGVLFPSWLKH